MGSTTHIKFPNPEICKLLRRLWEKVRPPELFPPKQNLWALLTVLVEFGEPGALQDLIAIALEADPEWQGDCARAVSAIARPLIRNRLAEWDEWARENTSYCQQFEKIKPSQIKKFPITSSSHVVLVGLCASHPNGYVRESALLRLSNVEDTSELGFLILRANDWVPSVQLLARTALMARLKPSYASAFAGRLILLDSLARATRHDQRPLLLAIEEFLLKDDVRPALWAGLDSPDYLLRRRCYELVFRGQSSPPDSVFEKALADADAVTRSRAYRYGFGLGTASNLALIRRAMGDPFGRIRRMAFQALIQNGATTDKDLFRDFLFSPGAELRRDAQREWRKLFPEDPSDVYRLALRQESGGRKAPALAGLGETGDAADVEPVHSFLKDARARVRRAAVIALCRLKPKHFPDELFEMMFTDSPCVAGAVEANLARHVRGMNANRLWDRALTGATVDAQVRMLRVFRQLSKWDRLEQLLGAVVASDAARPFALAELDNWIEGFNNAFTALVPAQRSRILLLLAEGRMWLSPAQTKQLDMVLDFSQ